MAAGWPGLVSSVRVTVEPHRADRFTQTRGYCLPAAASVRFYGDITPSRGPRLWAASRTVAPSHPLNFRLACDLSLHTTIFGIMEANTFVVLCVLSLCIGGSNAFQVSSLNAVRMAVGNKNKCCAFNVHQYALNGLPKSSFRTRAHVATTIQMATKTAVVTGSSSGIGLAAAKELADKVS